MSAVMQARRSTPEEDAAAQTESDRAAAELRATKDKVLETTDDTAKYAQALLDRPEVFPDFSRDLPEVPCNYWKAFHSLGEPQMGVMKWQADDGGARQRDYGDDALDNMLGSDSPDNQSRLFKGSFLVTKGTKKALHDIHSFFTKDVPDQRRRWKELLDNYASELSVAETERDSRFPAMKEYVHKHGKRLHDMYEGQDETRKVMRREQTAEYRELMVNVRSTAAKLQ